MSAQVELGWSNTELLAGARRAEGIVRHTAAQMSGALNGLRGLDLGRLAGIGLAGYSFAQLADGIAQATLRADDNKQAMLAVEGSIEGATRRLREMREVARAPGLGLDQVAAADVKLRSVGLTAALSERAILEVGNALALVGKGKADLDGVFLALTQIVSNGAVKAEEINQIAERVPQIRKILKDAFGTASTEDIQKLGLSSEEFIRKTLDGFSKLPRAVGGLRNSWENLTDSISGAYAILGEETVPTAVQQFDALAKNLEENRDTIKAVATNTMNFGRIVVGVFSGFKTALDVVGEGWANIINKSLQLAGVTDGTTKSFDAQMASARRLAAEQASVAREAAALARHQKELETATQRVADAQRQAAEFADRYNKALTASYATAAEKQKALQEELRRESDKTTDLTLNDTQRLQDAKKKLVAIDKQLSAVIGQRKGEELALQLNIEREKVMQRIVALQQQLGEDQKRANEDAARAADQAKTARQAALRDLVQRAAAGVRKDKSSSEGADVDGARKRIKGYTQAGGIESKYGLSGRRNQSLSSMDGPLSKGGPLTKGGGVGAFLRSQEQDGQFDRLQRQQSAWARLQAKRGQPGDPLFNPAAANAPAAAKDSSVPDILQRMLTFWMQQLT